MSRTESLMRAILSILGWRGTQVEHPIMRVEITVKAETAVTENTPAAPAPPATRIPEAKPDIDRENRTGRKPPKAGPCKRCGKDRPLNRLMLCYRCWVITNIEDEAKSRGETWIEGMPHPAWCQCVGLGEHRYRDGTSSGAN